MLRIAVVDDVPSHADVIAHYINNWSKEGKITCKIETFSNAENFLFQWEEEQRWDVLFLDIQMPGLDGMQLAKRIRKENKKVIIIFVTGTTDYLQDGYEVEAYRYLIKPICEEKVADCMIRMIEKHQNEGKMQAFSIKGEEISNHEVIRSVVIRIHPEDIVYIEAFTHYSELHTLEKCFRIREGISQWKERLDNETFLLCHRSYLINLLYVMRIEKTEVIMDTGEQIPLSRRNQKLVNEMFIKLYSRNGAI